MNGIFLLLNYYYNYIILEFREVARGVDSLWNKEKMDKDVRNDCEKKDKVR